MTGPIGVYEYSWFAEKFVGVRTEVVPLSLDEVSWQLLQSDREREKKERQGESGVGRGRAKTGQLMMQ